MNKTFIDQLIAFLMTPIGVVGVALGLLMVVQANRSRPTAWLLFSICSFAASLNTYTDRWVRVAPPLLFPLQQIRAYGRPLAIVLLILLIILSLTTKQSWRHQVFPKAIDYLLAVQAAIIFKTLLYGSLEFAIISGLTFGGIIFMLKRGMGNWLQNDENFNLAVRSIAITGAIFVVLNTYQFILSRYAITFHHGRFLGTTGNPQHAAVLLAATIPCLMFMIQGIPKWNFTKILWGLLLLVVMYYLLLTGSRTGALMGIISILLFYRTNAGAWFPVILTVSLLGLLILPFLDSQSIGADTIDASVSGRFTTSATSDTRGDVFRGLWQNFSQNLLFGAPMEEGGRLGFGENSWLAAGATVGLVGFIPMIMMGWECLRLMWQLNLLSKRQPYYFFQCSTVIAGLGSLLIGSIFEPYLLGNITFSLLAFLTYLLMGAYLLEVDRARTYYAKQNAARVIDDRSGVYQ
jgi:hypothetical protein